jgi:hypothetical protein
MKNSLIVLLPLLIAVTQTDKLRGASRRDRQCSPIIRNYKRDCINLRFLLSLAGALFDN